MRTSWVLRTSWPVTAVATISALLTQASGTHAEDARPSRTDSGALFHQIDANGDGQLSRDEVPADKHDLFERLLGTADKDGNGTLSREEFVSGLSGARPERPLDEKLPPGFGNPRQMFDPDALMRRLDANGDGKIVRDEVPEQGKAMFEKLLARADKDNDGAVSRQELDDSFAAQFGGKGGPQRDPARMFQFLDRNRDGKLEASEVPEERRPMFERLIEYADTDGDDALTLKEFTDGMRAYGGGQAKPAGDNPEEKPSASPGEGARPLRRPGAGGRGGAGPDLERFERWMSRLDKDNDGKISRAEFTGPRQGAFDRMDANHDGFIDQDEVKRASAALANRFGGQPNRPNDAQRPPVDSDDKPAKDKE